MKKVILHKGRMQQKVSNVQLNKTIPLIRGNSNMAFPHCDEAWKKFEVNPLDIGEIHYGQGNYYAAMQNFIAALILSTQFFTKPLWVNMQNIKVATWDERIFIKMIRCTSELGHYAESVILCQFLSNVDYVTAFKALEERNCFVGIENLYEYLWDMKILEYAVSVHNKKGDTVNKKKALETISQLQMNTANNEEILRQAQAARRSAFLRFMATNYLQ